MANGARTEFHPNRRVDMYAYRDKFDAALSKHMQGDSSDYKDMLTSEGFLTPSGKTTGAGRLNPMARTELNWDK